MKQPALRMVRQVQYLWVCMEVQCVWNAVCMGLYGLLSKGVYGVKNLVCRTFTLQ